MLTKNLMSEKSSAYLPQSPDSFLPLFIPLSLHSLSDHPGREVSRTQKGMVLAPFSTQQPGHPDTQFIKSPA